jgi:hypothetical protein
LTPIRVTDHALLRWLERRHGFAITALRAELEREVTEMRAIGATAIGGMEYRIENNVLVTICPTRGSKSWKPGCGR